jgi:putative membrane protein
MRLLFRWLVTSLAIFMVPHFVSGVTIDSFGTALAAAAILGILNVLIKPLLILFTLPLTLLSLGFFILIINGFVFELAGKIVSGLHVESFGSAFLAALIVSIVSWIMHLSLDNRNGRRVVIVRSGQNPSRGNRTIDLN